MYYSSDKQETFIKTLSIHHTTLTTHIANGTYYLNKYVLSREKVGEAEVAEMSVDEIKAMLAQDRADQNRKKIEVPNAKGIKKVHEVSPAGSKSMPSSQ